MIYLLIIEYSRGLLLVASQGPQRGVESTRAGVDHPYNANRTTSPTALRCTEYIR